jgi:hypothetical protein
MTLDEFEILLTEAYLQGDQAALDDLKLQAQEKLHTEGDRVMWERWEQHRMLESLIQDWPEPLLRKDLTQNIMSALDKTLFNPAINSSSLNSSSLSDPELKCIPARAATNSQKKPKVTKLDSFIITPANQQHQFKRYISRIGFSLAVFAVGVSLGLTINQAMNSFFYGSTITTSISDKTLLAPTYDAGINQNTIDLNKAIKDASYASGGVLDHALQPAKPDAAISQGINKQERPSNPSRKIFPSSSSK